jgi:hypothetical protein
LIIPITWPRELPLPARQTEHSPTARRMVDCSHEISARATDQSAARSLSVSAQEGSNRGIPRDSRDTRSRNLVSCSNASRLIRRGVESCFAFDRPHGTSPSMRRHATTVCFRHCSECADASSPRPSTRSCAIPDRAKCSMLTPGRHFQVTSERKETRPFITFRNRRRRSCRRC